MTDRPTCLECGKVLRPYRWPKVEVATRFGGYGDNLFCGLNCGYRWAVMAARKKEADRPGWLVVYRKAFKGFKKLIGKEPPK